MKAKKLVMLTLVTASLSAPVLSYALQDLVISNSTTFPVTSILNGGTCSTILGKTIGITQPGDLNHKVLGTLVGIACAHLSNCVATIFLTDHCGPTDQAVASVNFDASANGVGMYGVPTYLNGHTDYVIGGAGFKLSIAPSSTSVKK